MPWPKLFSRTRQVIVEATPASKDQFKGSAYSTSDDKSGKRKLRPGERSRATLWRQNDKIFNERSEVSSAFMALAGYVVARGYTTIPTDPKDEQANQAKDLCDKYAGDIGLDQIIYEGTIDLAKHGNLFLENKIVSKLIDTRIFPWQDMIEPSTLAQDGEIATWRQFEWGKKPVEFEPEEIIHLRLPPLDAEGFGTPLLQSIKLSLKTNENLDRDIGSYLHKSAFPKEKYTVLSPTTGQPVAPASLQAVYNRVREWLPGDKFATDMNVTYEACGVGNVESRAFPDLIKVNQDRCVDGLIMPPMSYLRNATEASATKMEDHVNRALILPIQRMWKRKIEREIFKPLVIGEGLDEKYTPSISFTAPTEKEISAKSVRVATLYNTGLLQGAPIIDRSEARSELDIKDPEKKPEPLPMLQPTSQPDSSDTLTPNKPGTKEPLAQPQQPPVTSQTATKPQTKPRGPHMDKLEENAANWTKKLKQVVTDYREKKLAEKEARGQAVTIINEHSDLSMKIALERLKVDTLPPELSGKIERKKQEALRDFEKILKDVPAE